MTCENCQKGKIVLFTNFPFSFYTFEEFMKYFFLFSLWIPIVSSAQIRVDAQGEVIAVGPGVFTALGSFIENDPDLVGKKIGLPKFGPIQVSYQGENYLVAKESEILFEIEE